MADKVNVIINGVEFEAEEARLDLDMKDGARTLVIKSSDIYLCMLVASIRVIKDSEGFLDQRSATRATDKYLDYIGAMTGVGDRYPGEPDEDYRARILEAARW